MKHLVLGVAVAALTACTHPVMEKPHGAAEDAAASYDYSAAFGTEFGRPQADYADYSLRKSQEILTFTGVLPGMTVLELEAGGGFYTDLFGTVVGDAGKVYQQNPAQFDGFLGDSVAERGHLTRMSQIAYLKVPFDATGLADDEADIVTWMLGPHELWFVPDGTELGVFGDAEAAFEEIARVLKPGGVFVALDHSAPAGAPASTGNDTHRIDKAIVIEMAEAAGLTLIEESDVLANPEDDLTVNVFDPSVRRKTDRFLLKFQK